MDHAALELSGGDLDNAYVDGEVKRAEVSAHLDHAQRVQYAEWVRRTEAEERDAISKEIGNGKP